MWKGRTIRKIVAVVLAGLMTGMLLTACTENKNGQQDAADAEDYIKVGIVIPQTGVLTAFGAGTEEMTQYALDQINEAGGLEVDGTVKKTEAVRRGFPVRTGKSQTGGTANDLRSECGCDADIPYGRYDGAGFGSL